LSEILEDPDTNLSWPLRTLLAQLQDELSQLQREIEEADTVILRTASEHEACRRLMAIPGIGPVVATATIAAVGNGADFEKGRGFAAWLGLVPRQYSTGGKQKLLSISKRGNRYLRHLFVHGARAVLRYREKQSSGLSAWLGKLISRVHHNVAAVALANKLARMAWAVLAKGETYRPPLLIAVDPVAA
jgi:transposase